MSWSIDELHDRAVQQIAEDVLHALARDERYRTAIHEAGHALAMMRWIGPNAVEAMEIPAKGPAYTRRATSGALSSDQQVRVSVAGVAAEWVAFPADREEALRERLGLVAAAEERDDEQGRTDAKQLWDAIKVECEADRDRMLAAWPTVQERFDAVFGFLDGAWPVLDDLARALAARGSLTAEDVAAIVAGRSSSRMP